MLGQKLQAMMFKEALNLDAIQMQCGTCRLSQTIYAIGNCTSVSAASSFRHARLLLFAAALPMLLTARELVRGFGSWQAFYILGLRFLTFRKLDGRPRVIRKEDERAQKAPRPQD